jgi:hypothetical protein
VTGIASISHAYGDEITPEEKQLILSDIRKDDSKELLDYAYTCRGIDPKTKEFKITNSDRERKEAWLKNALNDTNAQNFFSNCEIKKENFKVKLDIALVKDSCVPPNYQVVSLGPLVCGSVDKWKQNHIKSVRFTLAKHPLVKGSPEFHLDEKTGELSIGFRNWDSSAYNVDERMAEFEKNQ